MRISSTQSLVDDKFCTYSVNTWVRSVVGPHLKELDLKLFSNDAYCFEPPTNLSACINLVSLRQEAHSIFYFVKFHFTVLESLWDTDNLDRI